MSKGSEIIKARMPVDLIAALDNAIERINRTTDGAPHDRSTFLRECVRHKLAHMERGRKASKARPAKRRAKTETTTPQDGE